MSKESPPAPTASAIGSCPTITQIGKTFYPGPTHHPSTPLKERKREINTDLYMSFNFYSSMVRLLGVFCSTKPKWHKSTSQSGTARKFMSSLIIDFNGKIENGFSRWLQSWLLNHQTIWYCPKSYEFIQSLVLEKKYDFLL